MAVINRKVTVFYDLRSRSMLGPRWGVGAAFGRPRIIACHTVFSYLKVTVFYDFKVKVFKTLRSRSPLRPRRGSLFCSSGLKVKTLRSRP